MAIRRRNAWIFGACLAVGAVVFGVYWWSTHGSPSGASSRDAVAPTASADAADERALALRIRLLPDGGVSASPGSVRIGLAYVSPDELAAYQAWLRGGGEGAGPRDFEDLAAVMRWLNVPATLDAEGVVVATLSRWPLVVLLVVDGV